MRLPLLLSCLVASLVIGVTTSAAQPTQQTPQNTVKGQDQLNGSMGQFGTTYTLKNKLNITILAAHYSIDHFEGYYETTADTDGKLVVFDLAIKNADSQDLAVNPDGWFTLVDETGQEYTGGELTMESDGAKGTSPNLKPGQGLGQPELKNPLRFAIKVAGKARITKIIFGMGRLNTSEDVMRYMLAPAPKDPAKATDKNFISPLPDNVRDSSDPWGAITLPEGKGVMGQYFPSGPYSIKVSDISTAAADVTCDGNPPEDGKRFVVATVTGRLDLVKEGSVADIMGDANELTDADGERYPLAAAKKMKTDENVDHTFRKGDEYSIRLFFVVPKDAKIKHFRMGAGGGRQWGVDLP